MKILIAEDDFVSRRLLASYLTPYGPCDLANNGEEAIDSSRKMIEEGKPYDLICLDIMMPNLDGQKALKEIRRIESERGLSRPQGSKIIMTTALSDINNMWQAFSEHCDAYLVKPIRKEKLQEQLQALNLV